MPAAVHLSTFACKSSSRVFAQPDPKDIQLTSQTMKRNHLIDHLIPDRTKVSTLNRLIGENRFQLKKQ
jgi:hypothetical protein